MNNIKKHTNAEKELNNYRNELNEKIKNIKTISINQEQESTNDLYVSKESIKPNTPVFVTTLNKEGTVLSHISKSNEVQVQIGNLKMNLPINILRPISKVSSDKNSKNSSVNFSNNSKTKNAKTEINVIGLNVEEANFVIDKFLDDSSLAKLNTVRIIHGKGTGKLRDGIHKFLKKNSHVKSFRMGTFGEGEMGVTVVELR